MPYSYTSNTTDPTPVRRWVPRERKVKPYSRRRFHRYVAKKKNGKSTFFSKVGTVANVASKALRMAMLAHKFLNAETKWYDIGASILVEADAFTVFEPTVGIVQGDTSNDRTGRQIKSQSLQIDIWARLNSTVASDTIRMIVCKHLNGGSPPAISEVLSGSSIQSYRNLNFVRDIKMLEDYTFTLSNEYQRQIKKRFFIKNEDKLQWDINATTAAWGQIFVYFVGTIAAAAGTPSTVSVQSRLRFIDN